MFMVLYERYRNMKTSSKGLRGHRNCSLSNCCNSAYSDVCLSFRPSKTVISFLLTVEFQAEWRASRPRAKFCGGLVTEVMSITNL
jgi:hypothetical protein